MSFSAAPSFDPNVGTPATPAQSAGTQATPSIGFFDKTGTAYTGASPGTYSVPDEFGGYTKFDPAGNNATPGQNYYISHGGTMDEYGAYDTSKYASPQLAYLDNYNLFNYTKNGLGTQGVANQVQQLGLDPSAMISAIQRSGASVPDMSGPYGLFNAARVGGYSGPGADALNSYAATPAFQQGVTNEGNYSDAENQMRSPRQSMTGMDYLMDVVLPVATAGIGAAGGWGAMLAGDAAMPAAGISSGMAEMFPEAGATFAGQATQYTLQQALQNAAESAAKKAALAKLSGSKSSDGFNPTSYIKPIGDIASSFADGGSVDNFDFGDDNIAPDYQGLDPSDFGDVSQYGYSVPDMSSFDWSQAPPGAMGLLPGNSDSSTPTGGLTETGGMPAGGTYTDTGKMVSNGATGISAATGAQQSALGSTLQKLGYINDKGDVDLGKALKAGATVAALAVTYLNNKKLASSGAQMAASQVQPGQVFTLPNSALSNYAGAPYATGKPTNSNSVVALRAHGGLMQHHLAMGGMADQGPMGMAPPQLPAGPLGSPTGAMPPQMMPQGGMNRMPGGAAMQPPQPQMPTGGPPAWAGQSPPPSATPAPANHFAHGGALAMAGHAQNYQGHGAVRGLGGGQDDIVDARMAPGEYVFDADTVAALGDGSSEEGARRLDAWREHLRRHKRSAPADEIPPKAHPAPHYLGGKS